MLFKTFLISVMVMLISLVLTAIPKMNTVIVEKFMLQIKADNIFLCVIALIGFVAVIFAAAIEKKKLKKEIKFKNNQLENLNQKLSMVNVNNQKMDNNETD